LVCFGEESYCLDLLQHFHLRDLEAVLKTRTAFEKLSNQPPDASQNAPYHRYIHPICLIFYFCFRAYNNFKTASKGCPC
jgi:hypothetical protein